MVKIFLIFLIVVFVVLLSVASKQNKRANLKRRDLVNRIKNRDRYEN